MSELHLVTGANGFVGSRLCQRLTSLGKKVRGIDITPENQTGVPIDFRNVNILNYSDTLAAVEGVSVIHHTAALVPIGHFSKKNYNQTNIIGTDNLLKAAKEKKVEHFCHLSSSAIFGQSYGSPIPAEAVHTPIDPYGVSKSKTENSLIRQCKNLNISLSIIRPRTILGPGRLGLFSLVFERIRRGKNIYLIGSGQNQLQFTHLDDVVDIMVSSSISRSHGIYQVGSLSYGTVIEDLTVLCDYSKMGSKIICLPQKLTISFLRFLDLLKVSPLASWHYLTSHLNFVLDVSQTQKQFGWCPKLSNSDMLKEAYDWHLKNYKSVNEIKLHKITSLHRSKIKQGCLRVLP